MILPYRHKKLPFGLCFEIELMEGEWFHYNVNGFIRKEGWHFNVWGSLLKQGLWFCIGSHCD